MFPSTTLWFYNTTGIENIYLRGIYASSGGSGFFFHDNTVRNVQADPNSVAMFNFGGSGVMSNNVVTEASDALSANYSTGTQFLNNTISNSASGVHTDNSSGPDLISGNNASAMEAGAYMVSWVPAPYGSVRFQGNPSHPDARWSLASAGQGSAVTPLFLNNQVTAGGASGRLWVFTKRHPSLALAMEMSPGAFQGNTIQGFTYGFYLEDQFPTNNLSASITQNNVVTGNNYGVHGIWASPESVKVENTDFAGGTSLAAIFVSGGAIVDAGNCGRMLPVSEPASAEIILRVIFPARRSPS